jgi:hypothetical protein
MATIDPWPPASWGPKLYTFDASGRRVAVEPPGPGQSAATSDERQVSGPPIPDIGSTSDAQVAEDVPGPVDANGFAITPAAARRFSPSAAQGYRNSSPDPGSY